jgi:hypothetical protein
MAVASMLLLGCDSDSETVLSGPGESCTKTADCESGYKCINQVCQQAGADCPGDLDCSGLECGPDPVCGESCGTCQASAGCVDGKCVELETCGNGSCDAGENDSSCPQDCECEPDCSGLECGPDPVCGEACGTCQAGDGCVDGECVELETCGNGSCDAGENDSSCPQDCECEPDCSGLECGPDPVCGESCGTCQAGDGCVDGVCAAVTWTDPTSGLTWQVATKGKSMDWENAEFYCAELALAGAGWRLPTVGELRTLIRGCPATESGGSCNVEEGDCLAYACRDSSCIGCSINDGPAGGCYWPEQVEGKCNYYWSSSPMEDDTGGWVVAFMYGLVEKASPNHSWFVRCVR